MRYAVLLVLLAALVVGCGKDSSKDEAIPLDQVPAKHMKIAKEKLPDVKFDQARKRANGNYEVLGKTKQGKVREIELTPDGEVVEIE